MSTSVDSRSKILERIRVATKTVAVEPSKLAASYAAVPREYVPKGKLSAAQRIELLIERLREYDAEVVECTAKELPTTIAKQLAASGRKLMVAPEGVPAGWLASGIEWKIDRGVGNPELGLSAAEIDSVEGVLTAATSAIADSGTIVLHHAADEGRRILTLLPDFHLCVLRASQVVETLPEYFDRTAPPPQLATYISGPSATADIEMTRIKGVHGPRFLAVILVHDQD